MGESGLSPRINFLCPMCSELSLAEFQEKNEEMVRGERWHPKEIRKRLSLSTRGGVLRKNVVASQPASVHFVH